MSTTPLILVVDDEAPIRNMIESYLRAEGWDVITAINGNQAVESVRSRRPNLVVLDVLMPELRVGQAARSSVFPSPAVGTCLGLGLLQR